MTVEIDHDHTAFTKAVAAEIKEQREFLGWTYADLARAADSDGQTIKKIESGSVSPKSYTVRRLAHALDLHHDELISLVEKRLSDSSGSDLAVDGIDL